MYLCSSFLFAWSPISSRLSLKKSQKRSEVTKMNSEIYKPSETAIIVVDIQKPFYSGFPGIPETNPDFPSSITKFLSAAREKQFRICHVNQESLSGKDKWLETWYRKNGRDWVSSFRRKINYNIILELRNSVRKLGRIRSTDSRRAAFCETRF